MGSSLIRVSRWRVYPIILSSSTKENRCYSFSGEWYLAQCQLIRTALPYCSYVLLLAYLPEQVVEAIWRRPYRLEILTAVLCSLGLDKSLHAKLDLNPFNRVCTAKPRDSLTRCRIVRMHPLRRLRMRCAARCTALRCEWKYSLELAVTRRHSPRIASHRATHVETTLNVQSPLVRFVVDI